MPCVNAYQLVKAEMPGSSSGLHIGKMVINMLDQSLGENNNTSSYISLLNYDLIKTIAVLELDTLHLPAMISVLCRGVPQWILWAP